jgi:alkylation response protein AidB-like acyl-CoA dehydrogenase
MSQQRPTLQDLVQNQLRPLVSSIDAEGLYPREVLQALCAAGIFEHANPVNLLSHIQEIAAVCGSTAFLMWCHSTCINYIRKGDSDHLKAEVLPRLLQGEILGGTGLSNAMKYYAGMESLRLQARETPDGYVISGTLPAVSNLAADHWFGVVAEVSDNHRIAALVPCNATGLDLAERSNFLGMNGTATYACRFDNVHVPTAWILSDDADSFVRTIRPELVLNQTAIALGIAHASILSVEQVLEPEPNLQLGTYPTAKELNRQWQELYTLATELAVGVQESRPDLRQILGARLRAAYLAVNAAQVEMLHRGGSGYIAGSSVSRRMREALFIAAALTPTVKQLEKQLGGN